MNLVPTFLSGAIMLAAWAIALFFAHFYRSTRDRLFGFFTAAFFLLGLERISLEFFKDEFEGNVYLIRLCAFLLILFAIWDKNRKEKNP